MIKLILYLSVEIIIGVVILYFSLKGFLFYFFVLILATVHFRANYLHKLIRSFQLANEVKILTIMKKLNISKEDIFETYDEEKARTDDKDWKSLIKDLRDITGKNVIDD